MRDQLEASRPRNSVQQMREQAKQGGPPPLFNLNTVMAPIRFNQASLRDIFSSIAKGTGINITFDSTFQDRVYTVDLSDVTLAEGRRPSSWYRSALPVKRRPKSWSTPGCPVQTSRTVSR